MCAYWRNGYDWRAHESALNRFDQFITTIDGANVHFIHVRSPERDALPLVITHGWPGSVVEFEKIIGPLSDPAAHGGDRADAFHVVCPSIPGYGFSGPTHDRGWDVNRAARANATLMGRLGYERYGAQGGDWGSMISREMAVIDAEHMVGVHLNMLFSAPPGRPDDFDDLTAAERQSLADTARWSEDASAYSKIQGTRPQTLAYGLTDSPAGQLAWIAEKFRDWSDSDGVPDSAIDRDTLLTNVTVYWVTATAGSSARMYYETMHSPAFQNRLPVTIPTGAAVFPKEMYRPIRKWAEASHNIVHWSEFPGGGHFAAMEQPEALVGDVRTFFRPLR
jgi:microsomal epoxide hydrolase